MEQNTHDSEHGFIRLDGTHAGSQEAPIATRVLTLEGREHTITAVPATKRHANVIYLRPQWYGQIDGFTCTPPSPTQQEAIEAAIHEIGHQTLEVGLEAA